MEPLEYCEKYVESPKPGERGYRAACVRILTEALTYLRHLTTFQLLGIQFGVSESTANDTFNYWLPLLKELLPSSLLEEVKKTPVTKNSLKSF